MVLVSDIRLRRVLDSRGTPTVEADVLTERGFGRAIAPTGVSVGSHEATENPPREAIAAARERALPRLIDQVHVGDQRAVDRALRAADGTESFARIGANSAVAISMAAAAAAADTIGVPLYQHIGGTFRGDAWPTPLGNVLGGGAHAPAGTDIQEILVAPVGAPSVEDAVFANAAVHARVGELLQERGYSPGLGDEGAWAPAIDDRDALAIVQAAATDTADDVGFEIRLGIDIAGSELYADGAYHYSDASRTPTEQHEYVVSLIDEYDLLYVEDPFEESAFEAFASLTAASGDTLICGDDLFVTDGHRLTNGLETGAANSILIKPNQVGTLTASVDTIETAHRNGYTTVVSHRSGDSEDTAIAHLAVGTGASFIKTGAVGGERTAKLNELIRIADDAI